jgi:hypothetical protein
LPKGCDYDVWIVDGDLLYLFLNVLIKEQRQAFTIDNPKKNELEMLVLFNLTEIRIRMLAYPPLLCIGLSDLSLKLVVDNISQTNKIILINVACG